VYIRAMAFIVPVMKKDYSIYSKKVAPVRSSPTTRCSFKGCSPVSTTEDSSNTCCFTVLSDHSFMNLLPHGIFIVTNQSLVSFLKTFVTVVCLFVFRNKIVASLEGE
uniref:Uncharacterized protein n=2 Tax=Parascaris univalens TaxID=6257 RepID=A0A914ZE28_PARUN